MSAGINSNFSSLHLIPSSGQGVARQQQIQALANQVKSNEGKIAKIDKEIVAREKIIEASEIQRDVSIKGIQTCEESIVLLHKILDNNEKMMSILETLITRNEAAKAYSKASDCSIPGKAYTTPYDEKYEKAFKQAMDTSWTTKNLEFKKPENIDFFDRISHSSVERNYLFSMFTDWFSGFRSSTSSFFRRF